MIIMIIIETLTRTRMLIVGGAREDEAAAGPPSASASRTSLRRGHIVMWEWEFDISAKEWWAEEKEIDFSARCQ